MLKKQRKKTIGERINVVHRYHRIVNEKKNGKTWYLSRGLFFCWTIGEKKLQAMFLLAAEIRGAVFSRARAGQCKTTQDSACLTLQHRTVCSSSAFPNKNAGLRYYGCAAEAIFCCPTENRRHLEA
jgi:hypothetical protein